MSVAYGAGFICGVALVAIAGILIKKKCFKSKPVYDERQLLEQGKACKAAFYALIAYNMLAGLTDAILELNVGVYVMMIVGVGISIIIYAGICIWNEAYFPINQSAIKWIVWLFIIGVFNIFTGVMNIKAEPGSETGMGCLICAIMVIIVGFISLLKLYLTSRKSDEFEESDEEVSEDEKEVMS